MREAREARVAELRADQDSRYYDTDLGRGADQAATNHPGA